MVQAHRASPADHFQLPYAVENSQFQLFATAASTTTARSTAPSSRRRRLRSTRRAPRAARSLVLVGRVQGQARNSAPRGPARRPCVRRAATSPRLAVAPSTRRHHRARSSLILTQPPQDGRRRQKASLLLSPRERTISRFRTQLFTLKEHEHESTRLY